MKKHNKIFVRLKIVIKYSYDKKILIKYSYDEKSLTKHSWRHSGLQLAHRGDNKVLRYPAELRLNIG